MLTYENLCNMKPYEIIAKWESKIVHPWFNHAKKTVDSEWKALVKWIAVRGWIHDWTIYHSLGFEKADYFDGNSHLDVSDEEILSTWTKLTNKTDIQNLVPCDKEALEMYRF